MTKAKLIATRILPWLLIGYLLWDGVTHGGILEPDWR